MLAAVEALPEVLDSMVIELEQGNGESALGETGVRHGRAHLRVDR